MDKFIIKPTHEQQLMAKNEKQQDSRYSCSLCSARKIPSVDHAQSLCVLFQKLRQLEGRFASD